MSVLSIHLSKSIALVGDQENDQRFLFLLKSFNIHLSGNIR